MAIKNNGHHWQFRVAGHLVEWWPSSAKMVVDTKWKNGKHVHDIKQLMKEIEGIIEKEKPLFPQQENGRQ